MATRKKPSGQVGGALTFLGSLIYLYVYFTWYSNGYPMSVWLSTASLLAPFVIGMALFSAVTLFFMGAGALMGKMPSDPKMAMHLLWKFIMIGAVTFVIITGGTSWYTWVVIAFILTYLGGMASTPM